MYLCICLLVYLYIVFSNHAQTLDGPGLANFTPAALISTAFIASVVLKQGQHNKIIDLIWVRIWMVLHN